jgi:hypothetical protein
MLIEWYQRKSDWIRTPFFTRQPPSHDSPFIPTNTNGKLVLATLFPMGMTLRGTHSTIPEGNLFIFEGGIACTVFNSCFLLILEYLHQF